MATLFLSYYLKYNICIKNKNKKKQISKSNKIKPTKNV